MTTSRRFPLLLSLVFALLSFGCASRPETEINSATKSKQMAEEQRASEFAPTELQAAKETWDQAQAALQKEDYSQAQTLLQKARSRYDKAHEVAKAKRDRILKDAKGLMDATDARYKILKDKFEADKEKIPAATKKEIEDAFVEIDKGVADAKAKLDKGDYNDARTAANNTMRLVYDAEQALQGKKKG